MIEWLYPGQEPRKAYKTFLKIEEMIREAGYKGWLMASDPEHKNMNRHLMEHGGMPYALDDRFVYMKKELN